MEEGQADRAVTSTAGWKQGQKDKYLCLLLPSELLPVLLLDELNNGECL